MFASPALEATERQVTLQTQSGVIEWKETHTTKGRFDDRVAELSKDELAELSLDAARAPDFIAAFVPQNERNDDLLENLDLAFAKWLKSGKRDIYTSKDVIRIVGSALGSYDVEHLGVRWARVTDSQGSDIALVSDHPAGRSFPFTSVQYRIEDNKDDFIVALYRSLEHLLKPSK